MVGECLYSMWEGSKFVQIHVHVDERMVVPNIHIMLTDIHGDLKSLYNVKLDILLTEHLGIHSNVIYPNPSFICAKHHNCNMVLNALAWSTGTWDQPPSMWPLTRLILLMRMWHPK